MRIEKGILLCFIVTISFLEIKLLSVVNYEVTLSDVFLLSLGFLSIYSVAALSSASKVLFFATACFSALVIPGLFYAINIPRFFLNYLPVLYALVIIYCLGRIFSFEVSKAYLKLIYLFWSLVIILSAIPSILFFSGLSSKWMSLYGPGGWRYEFLTQNPNQYSVYLATSLFSLSFISLKLGRVYQSALIFLSVVSIIPMLDSGSRTGFLSLVVFIFSICIFLFYRTNIKKKGVVIVCVFVLGILGLNKLNFELEGQFARAASVGEIVLSGNAFSPEDMGPTGQSILVGFEKFKSFPMFGLGLGNFAEYHKHEVHNSFVSILVEAGIVGLFGYLFFLFCLVYLIYKQGLPVEELLLKIMLLVLFLGMNYPHYLMRQRWVWLFFVFLCLPLKIKSRNVRSPRTS